MIVNLRHGKDLRAADSMAKLTITLDESVKTIARLSKTGGLPVILAPKAGRISLSLPGGTGDLYKIGDANFPGRTE